MNSLSIFIPGLSAKGGPASGGLMNNSPFAGISFSEASQEKDK